MASDQHLELGLDQDLKERVNREFIRDGLLFGALPQGDLTQDEMLMLSGAGWTQHDYRDLPVMEPPHSTIDWYALKHRHRDNSLHAISHRLEDGAPWVGTRQEILEELLASQWERQEEELRTLLHAFAYASMWNQEEANPHSAVESQETFFFYTERMRNTALKATELATQAPDPDNDFWDMVYSLTETRR